MQYTIQNQHLTLTIDAHGAQPVSLCKHGKELLWQNRTGVWKSHAPILFPVCGMATCIVDGVRYPMSRHGFLRDQDFTLLSRTEDSISMVLESTEATLSIYPYPFRFVVTYTLDALSFCLRYYVENTGDSPFYFAVGGHESLNLDAPLSHYRLVFPTQEHLIILGHNDKGMLTEVDTDLGDSHVLDVPSDLLQNSATVVFSHIRSGSVTLETKDGTPVQQVDFPGFSNLLLWSPDGESCLCIEPWDNLPDTPAMTSTPFPDKPGVRCLLPGESIEIPRTITYLG